MPNPTPATLSRYARYSQWPVVEEATFNRGIIKDVPPSAVPVGGVIDAIEFLFDRPGGAHKRGGTAYQSTALGIAGSVYQVGWADFSNGAKLVAVAPGGTSHAVHVYDVTGSSSVDAGSGGSSAKQRPVFYNDHLILIGGGGGGVPTDCTNMSGTLTLADLAGSPPAATVAVSHGGYFILANAAGNPNRLWFSPVPDITATWDTTNAYIDSEAPITGLASVQGVLVIFHNGSCERLIGSIPPGTVGENMSLQPLSAVAGCVDPRSICAIGGEIVFADASGIWATNGSSVSSLTSRKDGLGVSSLWRQYMALYDPSAMVVTGGTFGSDYYWASILSLDNSSKWLTSLFLVLHFPTGAWSPFGGSGISCVMFTSSETGPPETYGAFGRDGRILKLSDLFLPIPTNKQDADGDAITPQMTTRMLGSGPNVKAYGHAHLTYNMVDAASDNPTLVVSSSVEQTGAAGVSLTAVAESPLAKTTGITRKRFTVNKESQSLYLTFAQTANSLHTEIYMLECEVRPHPNQSDGQ